MNAILRAKNLNRRIFIVGGVDTIQEFARVIAQAYEDGLRTGAVSVVDRAVENGATLDSSTPEERKAAILKAYYDVVDDKTGRYR